MDRDYLDDQRFPPNEGSGVLVIHAPSDDQLVALLNRIHRLLFQVGETAVSRVLPLAGRKLHVHTDWRREEL